MKTSVTVVRILEMSEDTGSVGRMILIRTREGDLMTRRLRQLLSRGKLTNVSDALLDDLMRGYDELRRSVPEWVLDLALRVSFPVNAEFPTMNLMRADLSDVFPAQGKATKGCLLGDGRAYDTDWSLDHQERAFVARLLLEMRFALKKRINVVKRLPVYEYVKALEIANKGV